MTFVPTQTLLLFGQLRGEVWRHVTMVAKFLDLNNLAWQRWLRDGHLHCQTMREKSSLRKHPFLLALRRWGRFARRKRNVPSGEERGETDVFVGWEKSRATFCSWLKSSCTGTVINVNFFVFLLPYLHLLHDHFLLRSRNFATMTTRQSRLMARLASHPSVPMRGRRAEWAWERIFEALKAPWEGQKKQPHATHYTSHFLVDPSHGPFSFLEMLGSPIKIAPRCLLKFGQRAKFAWNKKNNNKWMNNERLELTNGLFVAAIQQSCD